MYTSPKKTDNKTAPKFTPDAEMMAKMNRFNEELKKAGALLSLDGLQPLTTGARLAFAGGKASVTDGPSVEAKEVVGGFILVEARDMAEAVSLFDDDPIAAHCRLEIRPLVEDHRHSETGEGRPEFRAS